MAKKEKTKADESFEEADDALSINMDDVAEQSFENVPPGKYKAVIESVEYKTSESSGQPMWSVQMAITEGEFANRKLFTFLSFSPKALPGTKANIRKINPDLLSSDFKPKAIAESGELVGTVVCVKTKLEEYQGEKRTRVQNFLPVVGGDGFASA
jgi:hypothetical protein